MSKTKKRGRALVSALLAGVLVTTLFVGGCFGGADKTVVATYTGGEVSKSEFEKQYHFQRDLVLPTFPATAENQTRFLQDYITMYKVLLKQANGEGVTTPETGLDEQVSNYKDQVTELVYNGDRQKFEDALKKYGISDSDIKELAKQDAILRNFKAQKVGTITPTAEETKAYFDAHKAEFAKGTVSHVLVKTEDEAKKVKERLQKGEDFAKVAKEVSIDPTAAQNGGTMADADFGQFVAEFRDAIAKLPLNTISDPVHTEYGWHIIRVDKRTDPTFDSVKSDVEAKVREQKENAIWGDLYDKAQQGANIKVTLPQ
jgi:foldase protein PrsA